MKKIAIIGMGPVGVSVLRAMAKNPYYQNSEITLYDHPHTFGKGMPFQLDFEILLINQTADTMSLDPDKPLDFANWVEREKGIANGEKGFFPRPWYGQYIQQKLVETVRQVKPKIIYELASSIRVLEDGSYCVESASSKEQYDLVHLCIGHLPYQDPYQLAGTEGYILHPYPVEQKLAGIPRGARVGIVGTGLTAVDLMRYLQNAGKEYKAQFFSRSGYFPLYRENEPAIKLRYLTLENLHEEQVRHNGFVPLERMVEWFQLECADKGIDFASLYRQFGKGSKEQLESQLQSGGELGLLQSLIHKLDSHLAEFMLSLTEADKETFFAEYEPTLKHFRAPMPKESLVELLEWWNAGQIRVWENMEAVESLDAGFKVRLKGGETVEVDFLLNATGQDMEVKLSPFNSALLNQLINERILQPERFGGVQVLWPQAEAISQRHGVLEGLFVHGQLVQGIQYGNNARMLMLQAYQVVGAYAKRAAATK